MFRPAGDLSAHELEVLRLLLNAETVEMAGPETSLKKGTPSVQSPLGDLYLPLEGLVDVEAEKARLGKEIAKVDAEIAKVQEKLSNPNFAGKVPANVLEEHQKRLADWEARKDQILRATKSLEG